MGDFLRTGLGKGLVAVQEICISGRTLTVMHARSLNESDVSELYLKEQEEGAVARDTSNFSQYTGFTGAEGQLQS